MAIFVYIATQHCLLNLLLRIRRYKSPKALNVVRMEDAVLLSFRMTRLSPFFGCLCVVEKNDIIDGLVGSHSSDLCSELCQGLRFRVQFFLLLSRNQEHSTTVTSQGYKLSFKERTLLLRKTVTMLRSRDVIHREPASF